MVNVTTSGVSRLLMLLLLVLLAGCAEPYYGPTSPYASRYSEGLDQIKVADAAQIRSAGRLWTFAKPPEEVWDACLRVVAQYEGVLQVDSTPSPARRLLFIHGQEATVKAPKGKISRTMPFPKFMDVWIAVALFPEDNGRRTTVAAAVISPETGQPTTSLTVVDPDAERQRDRSPSTPSADANATAPVVPTVARMAEVTAALAEQNRQVVSQLQQAKDAATKWSLVPQATINEFFYHVGIHLYGPQEWREKFVRAEASRRPPQTLADLKPNTITGKEADLETQAGNWTSVKLRRSLQVVNCPDIAAAFANVATNLAGAAGQSERPIQVYVIASPEINAFALPNGDIFLCSGLLGILSDQNELAAVIAHELDHVCQHDTLERLKSARSAENMKSFLMVAGAAAGGAAGAVAGIGASGGAAAVATSGYSVTGQVVTNVVSSGVQSISSVVGQSMGTAMVLGYSRKTELRADSNGAKYVWAAGYDASSELRLFEKLRDCKAKADERKEQVVSGLINCKPGLEERTTEMTKALQQLAKAN